MNVPPVLIVGCYRSGTSLLRLILSAHSRIWISGEGAYIYRVGRKLASYGDLSVNMNLAALHRDIIPHLAEERWLSVPPFSALVGWVTQFGTSWRSILTFYGTWDARAQEKEKLSWWGDNAPYHVHEIPYFATLFAASKFLMMIRDPRDVYSSIKQNYKETYSLEDVTARWEKALLDGVMAQSVLGASRVRTVRYERLVTEPDAELKAICDFLEVGFEPDMLAFHDSRPARALSELGHHKGVVRPVFSTSVGKYRESLTTPEIERIAHRLRTPMRFLGYLSQGEYEGAALEFSGLPHLDGAPSSGRRPSCAV
jgi:hypothetical protein